jgi:hypothetical protein
MATVELVGIKGIFPLRIASALDNYLVVSIMDVTHLLLIDKEEMEDTQIPGSNHLIPDVKLKFFLQILN